MLAVGTGAVFLAGLLQYLSKNMALLVQNFCKKLLFQHPFSAILRLEKKKFRWPPSTKKRTFFAASLTKKKRDRKAFRIFFYTHKIIHSDIIEKYLSINVI